jgi:hypothetical protein
MLVLNPNVPAEARRASIARGTLAANVFVSAPWMAGNLRVHPSSPTVPVEGRVHESGHAAFAWLISLKASLGGAIRPEFPPWVHRLRPPRACKKSPPPMMDSFAFPPSA